MEKYDFSLYGNTVTVYPISAVERDIRRAISTASISLRDDAIGVLVYPVPNADFGITCFDKNDIIPREPQLILAALSCFFKTVRGFPNMELDVLYQGKQYEAVVGEENANELENKNKCKFKYTKTIKFADNTELMIDVYQGEKRIAVVLCEDSDLFDERILSLITSPVYAGVDCAMAVSFDGSLKMKARFPLKHKYLY